MKFHLRRRSLNWKIIAGLVAWLLFFTLYQLLLPQLVALGGYLLANAILGAGYLVLCIAGIRSTHRLHQKTEQAQDPEPIMQSWEYESTAKTGLVILWVIGILCWGMGVGLWWTGELSFLATFPIIGTFMIVGGYMNFRHAKLLHTRINSK